MRSPLYLTENDVRALAPSAGALADALTDAFAARSAGRVTMPPKTAMRCAGSEAFFHTMPAAIPGRTVGVKWVGGSPDNAAGGLPHVGAILVLADPRTGLPTAIIEAAHLTALRTAAISLLAARFLVRADACSIGFIGCGLQARAHLRALLEEFPIEEIAVAGRRPHAIDAFVREAAEAGLSSWACSADEAMASSDIVVSTVPARQGLTPFLDARRLRAGATAIMVDLGRSWRPEAVTAFDACFTDDMEQSGALAGNNPVFQAMSFAGDLPGLVTGGSGRCHDDTRLAFLFPGVALADIAAGACLLARAEAAGVGTRSD
jgi:ornithine cyclodeaminase/alanine dehydrogenase